MRILPIHKVIKDHVDVLYLDRKSGILNAKLNDDLDQIQAERLFGASFSDTVINLIMRIIKKNES